MGPDRKAGRDVAALKARAWELRRRGRTLDSVARELGADRKAVGKWLAEIERKELARLSLDVEASKVHQNNVLEFVVEEALEAWERSKAPRTRVKETKMPDEVTEGPDGKTVTVPGPKVVEVIQQTGDAHYVDRALAALAELRKLWGLNVADKANEAGPGSYAERLKALRERAARFDARPPDLPDEGPPATTPDADAGGPGVET